MSSCSPSGCDYSVGGVESRGGSTAMTGPQWDLFSGCREGKKTRCVNMHVSWSGRISSQNLYQN